MFLDFFCCFTFREVRVLGFGLIWNFDNNTHFRQSLTHREAKRERERESHSDFIHINSKQPLFVLRSNSNCVDWNITLGGSSRSFSYSIQVIGTISIRKIIALSLTIFGRSDPIIYVIDFFVYSL